ncbi:hypothetical protein M9Y10_002132 [Tritrichomonas musculus]|uniref:Myb-like domain-containing protein n=1 Tax=Tritrichomonas musculus TaxID=1915356 RepID=A0ABR2LBS7_9EUKA
MRKAVLTSTKHQLYALSDEEFLVMKSSPYKSHMKTSNTRSTSEEGIQKLIDFINRCPQYLQKKPYQYAIDRKRKEWSDAETNALIRIYEETENVSFATLALCFPGRNGNQVYNHFRKLLEAGVIKEKPHQDVNMSFDICMHRYFLQATEEVIAQEITDLFMSGQQITEKIVREKAMFHYYLPHVLAERTIYRDYKDKE